MNQEREMILKMLKDGKVTVEEAEALLQVLEESEVEQAAGSPIQVKDTSEHGEGSRDQRAHTDERDNTRGRDQHREGPRGFRFAFDKEFDFAGIGETVKQSLSGLKDTLREAMEGLKDMDFEAEVKKAFGKERASADVELEVESAGVATVSLGNGGGETGDVDVTLSPDALVRVVGRVTGWANDPETALDRANSVTLTSKIEANALHIGAGTGDERGVRTVRVDYQIQAPAGVSVSVASIGGDVRVHGVTADVGVSTISGDISLSQISGDAQARTKSGDIEAHDIGGDLLCATLSGDITVSRALAGVECDTKSGDVEIDGTPGPVSAHSVSGDVEVRAIDSVDTTFELRSVSGDLELATPPAFSARVTLTTTSGDIDCGLPLVVEKRGRTELIGVLAGGAGSIEMRTVSGDISLE
jgi:DUF4097 and DUF4098 domain-containing protein YvlB